MTGRREGRGSLGGTFSRKDLKEAECLRLRRKIMLKTRQIDHIMRRRRGVCGRGAEGKGGKKMGKPSSEEGRLFTLNLTGEDSWTRQQFATSKKKVSKRKLQVGLLRVEGPWKKEAKKNPARTCESGVR